MTRYVRGVARISYTTLMLHCVVIKLRIWLSGIVLKKASEIKIAESIPWPTIVERIVRIQSHLPLVSSLRRDRISELENSPNRKAENDAASKRGVFPKIAS